MSEDDWQLPVPREDPEILKAGRNRDDESGAGLVPDGNMVEGELKQDGREEAPSCPFSSH